MHALDFPAARLWRRGDIERWASANGRAASIGEPGWIHEHRCFKARTEDWILDTQSPTPRPAIVGPRPSPNVSGGPLRISSNADSKSADWRAGKNWRAPRA